MRSARLLAILAFVLFASGCLPVRYVTQAAAGQEDLNRRGISIDEVVRGGHLDRRTRGLLAHVAPIKAFGERFGLARTDNYERYVWIDRPAVVWVVSACHPLAFRPRSWRFPIVGSITYTGWFDRKEAKSYADELAKKGWDVDLRPSQAYSTLGWFDDPILSTMISDGDDALGDLADVILHETLHATFYVPNQSTLNESVASFFGDELAANYLDETVGPDSDEKASFLEARERGARRGRVMKAAHAELAELYASKRSREDKLAEKKRITDRLRAELELRRPVTNATLIQYKTYGSGKPELAELLATCQGSFPRMLKTLERVRAVASSSPPHADPAVLLRPLIAGGCP
ncbi:MAG: aminopeptidase [Labilithrix sp.]|nr:aminopeptidase [Labilithrix sp.]